MCEERWHSEDTTFQRLNKPGSIAHLSRIAESLVQAIAYKYAHRSSRINDVLLLWYWENTSIQSSITPSATPWQRTTGKLVGLTLRTKQWRQTVATNCQDVTLVLKMIWSAKSVGVGNWKSGINRLQRDSKNWIYEEWTLKWSLKCLFQICEGNSLDFHSATCGFISEYYCVILICTSSQWNITE
jgi:hypothetical protein